jgi:hypothetical protein
VYGFKVVFHLKRNVPTRTTTNFKFQNLVNVDWLVLPYSTLKSWLVTNFLFWYANQPEVRKFEIPYSSCACSLVRYGTIRAKWLVKISTYRTYRNIFLGTRLHDLHQKTLEFGNIYTFCRCLIRLLACVMLTSHLRLLDLQITRYGEKYNEGNHIKSKNKV